MKNLRDVDPVVLTCVLTLLAIGVAMVYSAGAIYAADVHGSELFIEIGDDLHDYWQK